MVKLSATSKGDSAKKLTTVDADADSSVTDIAGIRLVQMIQSITRKQFSWVDLLLAVCCTGAVLFAFINLIIFVVHLLRGKRGKLIFPALSGRTSFTNFPSSAGSTPSPPPPPPPPPPPSLALSKTTDRKENFSDSETLRIRPLTFKRPLTQWGFAAIEAARPFGCAPPPPAQNAGWRDTSIKSAKSTRSTDSNSSTNNSDADVSSNSTVLSTLAPVYDELPNGSFVCGVVNLKTDQEDGESTCTTNSDFVFGKNYGK